MRAWDALDTNSAQTGRKGARIQATGHELVGLQQFGVVGRRYLKI